MHKSSQQYSHAVNICICVGFAMKLYISSTHPQQQLGCLQHTDRLLPYMKFRNFMHKSTQNSIHQDNRECTHQCNTVNTQLDTGGDDRHTQAGRYVYATTPKKPNTKNRQQAPMRHGCTKACKRSWELGGRRIFNSGPNAQRRG